MESIVAAPETLSYAAARARVLDGIELLAQETLELAEARGRALRQPVQAPHPLPPFDNSSMDGVAVRRADFSAASRERPVNLPVVETIAAGHVPARPLAAGEAMVIMTGAMIPEGADAVVPFEDLERLSDPNGERVRIARPVAARENIRSAGADLAAGAIALEAGRELSAHDLALAGALGQTRIEVGRRPTAVILSTGDELLDLSAPLAPGAIRDSNLPMLAMLLEEAGALVVRATRVPDDARRVAEEIRTALAMADVVLTIGGVSAGDFDPVKQSLAEVGGIGLWRVAMKPGRPQAFGRSQGRLFFGLPGNPASVACVFEALVRPALRKLQGFEVLDRPRLDTRCAEAIDSRAGRTDFVRVTLLLRDGTWWATPAGPQISGHLTPQARAHGLLVVPESAPRLAAGDAAETWLLRWPEPHSA